MLKEAWYSNYQSTSELSDGQNTLLLKLRSKTTTEGDELNALMYYTRWALLSSR